MKKTAFYIYVSLLITVSTSSVACADPSLALISTYNTSQKKGTEIISIQNKSKKLIVSNSKKGTVDIYSIAKINQPKKLKRIKLNLGKGEQITSAAAHPEFDYFLAAIQAPAPDKAGRIEVRDISDGSLLQTVNTGIGPDAVVIDKTGQYALVANEAEEFILNRKDMTYSSPEGSLSLVYLNQDPKSITVKQISLPDMTGKAGFVSADDNRFIERAIDWNQDGGLTEDPVDLDNSGDIAKEKIPVGSFHGKKVIAKEKNGEFFMFPLTANTPDLLEPEYPVFSADAGTAWITLQENNGIVVIDTASATVKSFFGLGTTKHAADTDDNDVISFDDNLTALREPDGISITQNGKYLVTADEGDTDPKASKTKKGPAGGGRTISVFDAATGQFIADTGKQIDEMVHKHGFYPESRSDNKGSEPEMLVCFEVNGVDYVAAGLERANGVALVSLADPAKPRVVSVAAIDKSAKAGSIAPEGIAHYHDSATGEHFIITANEKNGSLSIFKFMP